MDNQPERSERILIVDDEEGIRHTMAMLLARHGFRVAEAENGERAFERLQSEHYEVVLTDVRMPTLDGLGFLAKVTQAQLPVTVIMMTAFVELGTAIEALKLGAADYVSKPCRAEEVLLKINMALERRRLTEERARLVAENALLREAPGELRGPQGMVGKNKRLQEVFAVIRKVADYKTTVLLLGESGTGKELLARALHEQSGRKDAPFVPINCGAIPESLLESELFGHVKGAFTDARQDKVGLIEEAEGGTLFLDEIGELPPSLQVKLLRFLQEDEIRPVGATHDRTVDVRVVAATSRDLPSMVSSGEFREDLYYRLNVLQINIPPLRERRDDIPLLVEHFLRKFATRFGKANMKLAPDALRAMMEHDWPGNVRELENMVERAVVLADGDLIGMDSLPEKLRRESRGETLLPLLDGELSIKKAIRIIERELIKRSLERTGGNRTKAAELLELSHRALLYKIKEYELT